MGEKAAFADSINVPRMGDKEVPVPRTFYMALTALALGLPAVASAQYPAPYPYPVYRVAFPVPRPVVPAAVVPLAVGAPPVQYGPGLYYGNTDTVLTDVDRLMKQMVPGTPPPILTPAAPGREETVTVEPTARPRWRPVLSRNGVQAVPVSGGHIDPLPAPVR
jgi:hypothetical protein